MKRILLLSACAAAMLSACACLNPVMFRKNAYTVDTWETWTSWNDAYGTSELRKDGVYYLLTARQDDTRDEPSDGYAPGLILSKELGGDAWQADVQADFSLPRGTVKRFSYGIWIGGDAARPSVGSPSAVFKLVAQRQNGPRPSDDTHIVFPVPGGRFQALPAKFKVLRFVRQGSRFSVLYSVNGRKFVPVLSADSPEAAAATSQKFFLAGFSGGDPQGAWARLSSVKFNGQEVLR